MIILIILLVLAVAALVWVFVSARGHASAISRLSELEGQTHPVDLAAFRNLLDSAETEYLRQQLTAGEFRRIHRERLRAASDYISCVSGNAAVLLRLGETARLSEDPQVVEAADGLVNTALRVRLYALLAQTKLYANMLLPGVQFSPRQISESYEDLTGLVSRLGRLQNQRSTVRLSAVL